MLRAFALNREGALNFPGAFMGLESRRAGRKCVAFEFDDGVWCRDANGDLNLPAVGFLVDTALGSAARLPTSAKYRVATVHLKMQFTGAPASGHVVAHAGYLGECAQAPLRQALSSATLMAGRTVVAHADAAFALFEMPPGSRRIALPWMRGALPKQKPPKIDALENHESQVLKRFDHAAQAATRDVPFIEHFWCGTPLARQGKAHLTVAVSPHLGNRSGNVHGGMLVGMAAQVANAAAPATMRLSNVSAWFISPGRGPKLRVRSEVVQAGRSFALVRTEILSAQGKRVIEAISQHVIA